MQKYQYQNSKDNFEVKDLSNLLIETEVNSANLW